MASKAHIAYALYITYANRIQIRIRAASVYPAHAFSSVQIPRLRVLHRAFSSDSKAQSVASCAFPVVPNFSLKKRIP